MIQDRTTKNPGRSMADILDRYEGAVEGRDRCGRRVLTGGWLLSVVILGGTVLGMVLR